MDYTKAISMLVTRRSSSGQTRYPNNTHSRYAVTFARSCALCRVEWKKNLSVIISYQLKKSIVKTKISITRGWAEFVSMSGYRGWYGLKNPSFLSFLVSVDRNIIGPTASNTWKKISKPPMAILERVNNCVMLYLHHKVYNIYYMHQLHNQSVASLFNYFLIYALIWFCNKSVQSQIIGYRLFIASWLQQIWFPLWN